MTTVIPPGITPTGECVVREIDGVGVLKFENYGPGEWMTKKGEPAKKSRRRYLLDDEELDSVSTIVGTLDKPALERWIEDQATRGAVLAERLGELQGVPEEDWAWRVKSLNLGASAKRDEGADRGTAIHAAFHALAVEGKPPNPADFPGVARPWVQGAMRAWLAMRPEAVSSEEITCHPELRYGGRPDLVAIAQTKLDPERKLTLIDYKTGKGRVYEQAHYQTRLYAMALACAGIQVERILIVGIDDQGGFELVECEATEADALALLHMYRSRKRINSGMTVQRNAHKALAA